MASLTKIDELNIARHGDETVRKALKLGFIAGALLSGIVVGFLAYTIGEHSGELKEIQISNEGSLDISVG